MFRQIVSLQPLVGNGTLLSKTEVIKRYRSLKNVNYHFLQILFMMPFYCIGKDENGNLYYY